MQTELNFSEFKKYFDKRDFSDAPDFFRMSEDELLQFNSDAAKAHGVVRIENAHLDTHGSFFVTLRHMKKEIEIMQRPDRIWIMPMFGIRLFGMSPNSYGPVLPAPIAASGTKIEDNIPVSVTWFSYATEFDTDCAIDRLIEEYALKGGDKGPLAYMNDDWYVTIGNFHYIPEWFLAKVITWKKSHIWGNKAATYAVNGECEFPIPSMVSEFSKMDEIKRNEFSKQAESTVRWLLRDRLHGEVESIFTPSGYRMSFTMEEPKDDSEAEDTSSPVTLWKVDLTENEGEWHRFARKAH